LPNSNVNLSQLNVPCTEEPPGDLSTTGIGQPRGRLERKDGPQSAGSSANREPAPTRSAAAQQAGVRTNKGWTVRFSKETANLLALGQQAYSHSIVAGGLEDMS
jgi:hypothetical protein